MKLDVTTSWALVDESWYSGKALYNNRVILLSLSNPLWFRTALRGSDTHPLDSRLVIKHYKRTKYYYYHYLILYDLEPIYVAVTRTHVIAASREAFYVWQFKTPKKLSAMEVNQAMGRKKDSRERVYHIDDTPSGAGESMLDFSKAFAVSVFYFTFLVDNLLTLFSPL